MRTKNVTGCSTRLAKAGYIVYGIDYEGHGKSSGLRCYIPNIDDLLNDCFDHFTSIHGIENPVVPCSFSLPSYFIKTHLYIVCRLDVVGPHKYN